MDLLSNTRSDRFRIIFVNPSRDTTVLVDLFSLGQSDLGRLGEFTRDGLVLAYDFGADSVVEAVEKVEESG